MSTNAGAAELLARIEADRSTQTTQEFVLDDSNEVSFPGFPYTFEALEDQILVSIDLFKSGLECKVCKGTKSIEVKNPNRVSTFEKCTACNGIGASIILLSESKRLPSHGVVVSMGSRAQEEAPFKIGDRILFGEHAGSMVPTKAGLMFKYMDWYQAKLKIRGAEDLAAFDFIIGEQDRQNEY